MFRLRKKLTLIIVGVALMLYSRYLGNKNVIPNLISNISESTKTNVQQDDTLYDVINVVDGDTYVIDINGVHEKVRLIGVDTPESVHPNKSKNTEFGKEVSNYVKELLTGKKVSLEFDVNERDRYGRVLAYVYLEDGTMLQELLLSKGYANLMTIQPNVKYVDRFKNLVNK